MRKREMYYTVKSLAEELKLNERTIRNLITDRKLKAIRLDDGSLRIPQINVDAYLAELAARYPHHLPRRPYKSIANPIRGIIFERDHGICQLCFKPVTADNFHIDHKTPRARGGMDDISNLQLSHPRCNILKGAKINFLINHERENTQNAQ